MRKISLIVPTLLTLLWSTPAAATEDEDAPEKGENGVQIGYFVVSQSYPDWNDLNGKLESAGRATVPDRPVTLGGMLFGNLGRWILGLEYYQMIADEGAGDEFRVRIDGDYFAFTFGYSLASVGRMRVIPMLSLGGSRISLDIVEDSSPSFDELLTDPRRESLLDSTTAILGANLTLAYVPIETDYFYFSFALQAGYSIGTSFWMYADSDLSGGPDTGLTGAHLRGMVGIGGPL